VGLEQGISCSLLRFRREWFGKEESGLVSWAVGEGGSILIYAGNNWSGVTSPTTSSLRDITPIPGGGFVAVGDNGVVLITD